MNTLGIIFKKLMGDLDNLKFLNFKDYYPDEHFKWIYTDE